MGEAFLTPAPGPAVESILARDLAKRGVMALPLIVGVAAVLRGADGAVAAALACAIVIVNFLLGAALLTWAARISLAMIMAAALGGFLLRMGLVVAVVASVRNQPWIDLPTLAVAVLLTQLGLLFWETRHVSASLAYPALKPSRKGS
jgi:hypothetical protein